MALETGTFINDLVATNPAAGDVVAQGDDHLRLLKAVLRNTFPGLNVAVDLTPTGSIQHGSVELGHVSDTTLARVSAGDMSIEGNIVYRAGGTDVPVADGGTGAGTAPEAATNLGLGVGSSPQFTAVNIGHATDTTVARASAGDLSIEGNIVYRAGGTDVPVTDGGTGSSTPGGARTNLDVPGLATSNNFTNQNDFESFSTTGASSGKRVSDTTAVLSSSRAGTGNLSHMLFYNPNGLVGGISTDGSNTVYGTTSDGELKDAVVNADRASVIAKIKAGRPVDFEFKSERGVKHLGFIAQEMHVIFPDAVIPGDEDTPWMMDYSKLVPVLWAVAQDLVARLEALEAAR